MVYQSATCSASHAVYQSATCSASHAVYQSATCSASHAVYQSATCSASHAVYFCRLYTPPLFLSLSLSLSPSPSVMSTSDNCTLHLGHLSLYTISAVFLSALDIRAVRSVPHVLWNLLSLVLTICTGAAALYPK